MTTAPPNSQTARTRSERGGEHGAGMAIGAPVTATDANDDTL